jgi:hypothetical protein
MSSGGFLYFGYKMESPNLEPPGAPMLNRKADPVMALPPHYREVHYMSINERGVLLWLNLLSLVPLAIGALLVFGALLIYHEELGSPLIVNSLPDSLPAPLGIAFVLMVLPMHEWLHGLMIARYGHRPRYGVKLFVLFATSDGALFRRGEFIRIALAPLTVITVFGSVIMLFLPFGLAYWVALAVILNAGGAIGDLWMTAIALRHDPSVLIRDEEDSMRIFARANGLT